MTHYICPRRSVNSITIFWLVNITNDQEYYIFISNKPLHQLDQSECKKEKTAKVNTNIFRFSY